MFAIYTLHHGVSPPFGLFFWNLGLGICFWVFLIFGFFKREKKEHHENKESANNNEKNSEKKINYLAFLREKGYVVVKRKEDIQIVSDELRKRGLAKKVKGVVGFDGNLYLCTLSFLEKMEVAIKRLLKRQKEIDLKRMLKKDEMKYEAYKTALTLLLEKGEIIEKERDVFCLA